MPDRGTRPKDRALINIRRLLHPRFVHNCAPVRGARPAALRAADIAEFTGEGVASRPYLAGVVTVIIPAHNEARVIGRLLGQLTDGASPSEFDVIVVANGCTDNTAEVAAASGPPVRVLSIPVPSKREALLAGDRAARDFPRVYVDADVEIRADDIRALAEALSHPEVLAAGPQRVLALDGSPRLVRWYYDVWTRLPEVRNELFGRGVIGMSAAGHARVAALPPLLADDLAWSLMFGPDERNIVGEAEAVVHPPKTFRDLLRRRIRAATGVSQVESTEGAPTSTSRTRPSDLLQMIKREPRMTQRVMVFMAVAVAARWQSSRATRKGDYATWLRDESSRR
jgi:glycosyltransferase involved in cell wall biosynthesis